MKRILTALPLLLGLATAAHAAAPVQNCVGTPSVGTVSSINCGVTNAVGANNTIIGVVSYDSSVSNVLSSITDDKSNPYTILDTIGPHFGPGWYTATFVAYNLTNGPKTVTANFSGAGSTNAGTQVWWSEYSGVNGTDAHTAQYFSAVSTLTANLQSGNITTTNASDTIWGSAVTAAGVVEDTPAALTGQTGLTARISDTAHNGTANGAVTSDFSAPAGTVAAAFTSSVSDTQAAFVVAMKPSAVPSGISCSPAALTDSAAINTSICTPSVTMSDGSGFSGTLSVAPTSVFKIAGGVAELSRALTSADDGTAQMTLSALQNGVTFSKPFNVQISPTSQSGTPYTFGWKNIDPGAGANDGPGIVTMPRTGTIQEITVRVAVPATAPALFDIYHAAANQVCSAGSKIHVGDLNAAAAADSVQIVSGSNLTNTSLAIGDTLCIVTQQPFPSTGEVSLTVTVL